MPDEKGTTRRERNENAGEHSPPLLIPQAGKHLWDLYFSVSETVLRINDGICVPIPPSEFKCFFDLSDKIVYAYEYAILREMDKEFCLEMNKELRDYQARMRDEQKREIEKKGY